MNDFIKATVVAVLVTTIGLHLAFAGERKEFPNGFSSTPAVDQDDRKIGVYEALRKILVTIQSMHKTQEEILKHEANIDANLQRLADKLAK